MRAAHFLYHQPVVFNDPYALQLTSPTMRRACQNRFIGWLLRRQFISERDMMDESRYIWMEMRPLALILIGTYDHHQEHFDKLLAWLKEHGEV